MRHIIDLGCGSGDYSIALAGRHPGLRVTSSTTPPSPTWPAPTWRRPGSRTGST
ncbi:hypothetical protein ACFQZ0_31015 [Streptomyces erythrogriseus]